MSSSSISRRRACPKTPSTGSTACASVLRPVCTASRVHLVFFLQNLDYNVPGGKLNRGLSVVDTVAILKGRALTDDEYFKAAVLGWCVELVRIHVCVAHVHF